MLTSVSRATEPNKIYFQYLHKTLYIHSKEMYIFIVYMVYKPFMYIFLKLFFNLGFTFCIETATCYKTKGINLS